MGKGGRIKNRNAPLEMVRESTAVFMRTWERLRGRRACTFRFVCTRLYSSFSLAHFSRCLTDSHWML